MGAGYCSSSVAKYFLQQDWLFVTTIHHSQYVGWCQLEKYEHWDDAGEESLLIPEQCAKWTF